MGQYLENKIHKSNKTLKYISAIQDNLLDTNNVLIEQNKELMQRILRLENPRFIYKICI
jgi:hypothetical protein